MTKLSPVRCRLASSFRLALIALLAGFVLVLAAPASALAQPSAAAGDGSSPPQAALANRIAVPAAPASHASRPLRPIELAVMFGQTVGSVRIYAFAQDRSEELWGVKSIRSEAHTTEV